ncbi:MAG TPA: penicillin-binding protein 2 [Candidatus Paceibacterota bacterium]|nr:penicillin-binding protein 2 [Candidatus Paceibacterota bacterium]
MAARFSIVVVLITAAFFVLGFHLYQLQVSKGDYYYAQAASEVEASQSSSGNRGSIYFTDEDGNLLPAAVEQEFPYIYADPSAIADADEAANTVGPMLGMSVSTLEALFSKPNDSYELLERKADDATAQSITDLNMKGIYAAYEPERYDPLGPVASQVLGYVGPNATNGGVSGHYGVEGYYESTLSSGTDVTLTIDPNIQIEAEKVLSQLIASSGATGGDFIVEDPKTGKILAMGASPDFDPNSYASSSLADFTNPNVNAVYEPGSIWKVLTMAAGIDAGKITSSTTYDDKGYVNVDGAHITNYNLTTYGAYGPGTTMTEVIEHSINSGAIFAENQTGNSIFAEYMKKFHLDQPTGIDLPGEATGDLSQLNPKSPQVDFDTAAYGQGVAVTPIELVTAVDAIVNGGVMMRPYLNAALQPEQLGRAISTSTAAEVTEMMVSAIDDVVGAPAIPGYSLGGKTGSAFIPDLVHGGYTDQLIDSYIGFGPTTDPQFLIFIRLNTLPESSLAVDSVVPGFKELAQYVINYYNIPPDRPTNQ